MLQNHTFHPVLGGIENYLYYVSKTLKEMGHRPIILCEKHNPELADIEIYDGIKIITHPYYNIPKRLLLMKPKMVSYHLKGFISKHVGDVDFVISRYPHYCFATCSLNLDTPVVYIPPSVHWKQLREASTKASCKEKFFNFLWKRSIDHMEKVSVLKSNKTVVFSSNMAESLQYYYGLKGYSFYILPPGVDLDRFSKAKDYQLLRELDISPKNCVILYVGRLSPEKNVETLIKEFQLLRRDDVNLLLVGYGSDKHRLETSKAIREGGGRIRFLGRRTDVEKFYSIADIFVSPSKHEPFGQVILEAMAAGVPCIAFKRVWPEYEVASEEIIETGITGYCVDPYDKNEFRQRLLYLIENPHIARKMGEAGRKVCQGRFTWEGHVKKLLDLVSS
jgi:glycosyltransferase involved in cell wall biosynthesis